MTVGRAAAPPPPLYAPFPVHDFRLSGVHLIRRSHVIVSSGVGCSSGGRNNCLLLIMMTGIA